MSNSRNRPGKNVQKQDVASKVKDMRQRHDMWLREREQSLKKGEESSRGSYQKEKYTAESVSTGKRGVGKFGADILPEAEIRLPVTPSTAASSRLSDGQNEDDWAESIVQRVKGDLKGSGAEERYQDLKPTRNSSYLLKQDLEHAQRFRRQEGLGQRDVANRSHEGNSGTYNDEEKVAAQAFTDEVKVHPANHSCPCCSSLMSSDRDPVLMVPCGHSICSDCCSTVVSCPVCHCAITRTTVNIMLKQIIADYSHVPPPEPQEPQTDVQDKLHTLSLRLELMDLHVTETKRKMASIQQELKTEKQTIHEIGKEEERVREQIRTLEQQLQDLSVHKQEYVKRCQEIQEKLNSELENMNMVKQTIQELQTEKDKLLQ